MQKTNKTISGYHLLMLLSAVDGEFAPEEGLEIREYLLEEFPFRINLDNELDIIANLKPEQWEEHFKFQAQCFKEDSTDKERVSFLKFAKTLIKADHKIVEEEHHFYKLLKNLWGF